MPLGAALATIASVGRLVSARVRTREPLGSRETWMFGLIVLPVVLLLTLPPATLDSYAVNRRSNSTAIGSSARIVSGPIDLVDVAAARAVVDAWLAGRSAGVWPDMEEFARAWKRERRFTPALDPGKRERKLAAWRDAVRRTFSAGPPK